VPGTARIGIDIGGTFTDVVYSDGAAEPRHIKTLTTPDDITTGILAGLEKVGADVAQLRFFLHGTTVALNAFLEAKTPPVGLVTTAGFRDVLEIMRTNRPDMYDLQQVKPAPLVARRFRREISARTTATGEELAPVLEDQVRAIARDFLAAGIRGVAVCLLHSYADPAHERRVREILLDAAPELSVSISSDLSREWREFERTSTTVVNAATAPIMDRYLRRLRALLAERGFDAELLIMQSSSGVMSAADAASKPAATLMSGPVGGVAGAEAVVAHLGESVDAVTLDIGGTSADVAIIDRGHAVHTPQAELARWPVLMPMVDIQSIGAGGGSIASVDAHGRLFVGPESAGSAPGPVCYGQGGTRTTVTDANLVLGRIDGARFLDGAMPLDAEPARAAIAEQVAGPLGLGIEEAAEGILTVVNSNMARLLRDVLIQRGYDPRAFALVAFGGGGALHACDIAREAGIRRVVVPQHPGTLSAYGIYRADVRQDRQSMFLQPAGGEAAVALEGTYAELEREAVAAAQVGGSYASATTRTAELRYSGQEYSLTVPGGVAIAPDDLAERFHAEHERLYGFARRDVAVEFVKLAVSHTVRTGAHGNAATRNGHREPRGGGATSAGAREAWESGRPRELAVYDRPGLAADTTFAGSCVIEEPGATTYVPLGWRGAVDAHGNLLIERGEETP
jgi:N-methylhydantoinase A/oxoprolinase/acetone carboxylase beta subunit